MVNRVAVVGVGWMGRGLAQACAMAGFQVTMHDSCSAAIRDAEAAIHECCQFLVDTRVLTSHAAAAAQGRLQPSGVLRDAVRDADLVIECIPEVLDLKAELFAELDAVCGANIVLATNTSTLSISRIAEKTKRPERVVGIHWFYPAYLMPPVEIIPGTQTSAQTLELAKQFVIAAGKTPIVCNKEVPGFIINRLQFALFSEATALLEQGVASAEEIDRAGRLSLGLRLPFFGPLMFEDVVGTKRTILAGYEYLHHATGESKFRPPETVKEMVSRGELGLATGRGHFDYRGYAPTALARMRDQLIARLLMFVRQQATEVQTIDSIPSRGRAPDAERE